MLARIADGVVVEYPYAPAQLRAAFPQTSFPSDLSGCDLAAFGVVHVVAVNQPALQPGEAADEGTPALVSGEWRQTWAVRAETPEELAAAQAAAIVAIDAEAEAARLLWITPGAGQALEYQATEEDARRYQANNGAGDPEDYPWLRAELLAIDGDSTLADAAASTLAQADAWVAIGSEIKRIRRTAKLAVAAATTIAAVRAAASGIAWPQPE